MGYVKSHLQMEAMLDASAISWAQLTDCEYASLVSKWRASFDELVRAQTYAAQGVYAIEFLESQVPFSGWVFNLPNYRFLPVVPSSQDPTFGYEVGNLSSIKRDELNSAEAIVCAADFEFCCVFNHEGGALVPEILFRR